MSQNRVRETFEKVSHFEAFTFPEVAQALACDAGFALGIL
jgi:hypothetical protein